MKTLNNSFCSCRAVKPIIAFFVCMLSVVLAIPAVYADTSPSMGAIYSGTNTSSEFNGSSQLVGDLPAPLEYITCPSADYDYCWRGNYTYGSITATAEVYISDVKPGSGNVAVRPYMNAGVNSGSKLYVVTNKSSWDAVWAQAACDAYGCSGATELSPGKYYLLSSYGAYTDCPVFITWNKATTADGGWVAAWTGYGWIGTGNCITVNYAPDIRVDSFVSPPAQVTAGNNVSFTVRIKNYGDQNVTKNVEAAILPATWDPASLNYAPESSTDAAECCPANTYYNARSVTIAALSTEDVTFTVVAPTEKSIDNCDKTAPTRSAWGSSFMYRAGLYAACGEGYSSYLDKTGVSVCTYDPTCTYSEYDCSADKKTVQEWNKVTACGGGCSSVLKKGTTMSCASDQYCYDPGHAYCQSCSKSCDGTCQSSACYGTDPDCNSAGGLKDCSIDTGDGGGGSSCSGQFIATTKDNSGATIAGLSVYLDGTYKGITDATGKITLSATDTSCGKSHRVSVYCSDGKYCDAIYPTINYNNDADYLNFNCPVCKNLPALSISANAPTTYQLNDPITLEITVKDNSNNLVSNAYVQVCDPFDNPGCPNTYHYAYTGSDGKIQHNSQATDTGAHTFQIGSTKDGYVSATAQKTVTVGSFTGKINVDVDDLTGRAISGAPVYLDGTNKGTTNVDGEFTLYPKSSGTYEVKVNCPSGALCGTKSVDVSNGAVSANFDCDCTVKTGDLRVDVDSFDGTPVADVYILIDGVQDDDRRTNMFGSYYIPKVVQGSHEVSIRYYDANGTQKTYSKKQTANIANGLNVVSFTATADPEYAEQSSAISGNGTEPQIAPIIIGALTVAGIYLDVIGFCDCAYPNESRITCLSDLAGCKGNNDCVSIARNKYVAKMSECKLESAFLASDVIPVKAATVPVKYLFVFSVKELKRVDTFVDISKVWFDTTEKLWKYKKDIWGKVVEFYAKEAGSIFKRFLVKGTWLWPNEALDGLEYIVKNDENGKAAAEGFVTAVKEFGDAYAQRASARVALVAKEFGDDVLKKLWKTEIGQKALKEWDDDSAIRGLAKMIERNMPVEDIAKKASASMKGASRFVNTYDGAITIVEKVGAEYADEVGVKIENSMASFGIDPATVKIDFGHVYDNNGNIIENVRGVFRSKNKQVTYGIDYFSSPEEAKRNHVRDHTVPHELQHKKVYDLFGDIATKLNTEYTFNHIRYFYEFDDNVKVLNGLKEADKTKFIDAIRTEYKAMDIKSLTEEYLLDPGKYDLIAYNRAMTQIADGLATKTNEIDNALDTYPALKQKIIDLSDQYLLYAQDATSIGDSTKLNIIAKMTAELKVI